MGNVIRFRRRPSNRGKFRGQGGWKPEPPRRDFRKPRRPGDRVTLILTIVAILSLAGLWWAADQRWGGETFSCPAAIVLDGDTFDCGGTRVRLNGIDAPEMPGHCRKGRVCTPGDPYASTENLRRLLAAGPVQCRKSDTDVYGRTVARCEAGGVDLSCQQLAGDFAVRRYSPILCLWN